MGFIIIKKGIKKGPFFDKNFFEKKYFKINIDTVLLLWLMELLLLNI
jgi:hypothetical protein